MSVVIFFEKIEWTLWSCPVLVYHQTSELEFVLGTVVSLFWYTLKAKALYFTTALPIWAPAIIFFLPLASVRNKSWIFSRADIVHFTSLPPFSWHCSMKRWSVGCQQSSWSCKTKGPPMAAWSAWSFLQRHWKTFLQRRLSWIPPFIHPLEGGHGVIDCHWEVGATSWTLSLPLFLVS